MKQLLTDILTRIKTEIPQIKYVDEDWGQLDFYANNPPVQFPAVVIDCINVSYTNEGRLVQLGDVQVRIRIADQKLSNSSGMAPATQRDNAFAIYDLLATLHSKIHGWPTNKSYSRLIRVSLKRLVRQDGMRIHELMYTTRMVDGGTPVITAMADPDITLDDY